MFPVPPEDGAQDEDPSQVVFVPTRYTVLAAGNVMPELPPQLPAPVGEAGEAAPASVMSSKSQWLVERVPTVRVLGVPVVLLRKWNLLPIAGELTVREAAVTFPARLSVFRALLEEEIVMSLQLEAGIVPTPIKLGRERLYRV